MKRQQLKLWFLCLFLWVMTGTVQASDTGQGAVPQNRGQTDVYAGVIVDYMGKLRFEVYQRGTTIPIEGASVEIYIPSLDRYVLFGLTDRDGVYELDIAYNMDPGADLGAQFTTVSGDVQFHGNLLYLDSNLIKYRVYKAGWLLYPTEGEEILQGSEIPHIIKVYLYKEESSKPGDGGPSGPGVGSGGGGPGSTGKDQSTVLDNLIDLINDSVPLAGLDEQTSGLPKTGVEGAIPYWIVGMMCFLLSGMVAWYLLKREKGEIEG